MISFSQRRSSAPRTPASSRGCGPIVEHINSLEAGCRPSRDAELQAKTAEFRERLDQGATLDDLLPEAFAVCREAGRRVLRMRHFDVQLIGGMVLHQGSIAEMRTGEGKTLVATLPVLPERARRARASTSSPSTTTSPAATPSGWAASTSFLGLTRRRRRPRQLDDDERQARYRCDITYGTNNEFGFDYLRDNMKFSTRELRAARAQLRDRRRGRLDPDRRGAHAAHHLAARPRQSTDMYQKVDEIIPALRKDDRLHRRREGALGDR